MANPYTMVEKWERYLDHRGAPQRSKGPQPYTCLLSLQYRCWEEECPHLAVKNWGFHHSGEMEGCRETQMSVLKGPHTDSHAHRHRPDLGGRIVTQKESETYWERLSCMASGKDWKNSCHFSCASSHAARRQVSSFLC